MEKKKIVSVGFTKSAKEIQNEEREFVSVRKIIKPEYIERFKIDKSGIEDLAENIKAVGLINPLVVKRNGEKFEIVAGHRRFLALKMLGANKISCVIVKGKDYELEMVKLSENLLREDINVMEETEMLKRLRDITKFNDKKLAKSIGKSEGYVRQRMNILKYPDMLKEALIKGEITFSVSRELVRLKNENMMKEYLKHAVNGGATPALVKNWVDDILFQDKIDKDNSNDNIEVSTGLQVPGAQFFCFICGEQTNFNESQLYRIDHECSKALKSGGQ